MKTQMCLALLLAAAAASPAVDPPADAVEELRNQVRKLQSENRLLKTQIETLQKQLRAVSPESPSPADRKRGAMSMTLYDEDSKWWRDVASMAEQIRLRTTLFSTGHAKSTEKWLEDNKGFVGRRIDWVMRMRSYQKMTKAYAQDRYHLTLLKIMTAKRKIQGYGGAGTKVERAKRRIEKLQAEIKQLEAEARWYKSVIALGDKTFVTARHGDLTVLVTIGGRGPDPTASGGEPLVRISGTIKAGSYVDPAAAGIDTASTQPRGTNEKASKVVHFEVQGGCKLVQ